MEDKDRRRPDEDEQAKHASRESHEQEDAKKERERGTDDLGGLGQAGTSEPQPGIGETQGGGIEDAIGGGQSGQGGG